MQMEKCWLLFRHIFLKTSSILNNNTFFCCCFNSVYFSFSFLRFRSAGKPTKVHIDAYGRSLTWIYNLRYTCLCLFDSHCIGTYLFCIYSSPGIQWVSVAHSLHSLVDSPSLARSTYFNRSGRRNIHTQFEWVAWSGDGTALSGQNILDGRHQGCSYEHIG